MCGGSEDYVQGRSGWDGAAVQTGPLHMASQTRLCRETSQDMRQEASVSSISPSAMAAGDRNACDMHYFQHPAVPNPP